MTNLVESVSNSYKYLIEELSYPLSRHLPLLGSPLPLIGIIAVYTYFCMRLGPQFMQNRKPFNLKKHLLVYNLIQVLLNIYMCYGAGKYIFSEQYSFICQNVDDPAMLSARTKHAVRVGYVFYMVKYLDLVDTIFFVLRKSYRQITILHLHHHMVMPLGGWVGMTFFPGGPAAIIVFLNSFVHSIMYTYYLLAGLGEDYKKYLWWKKYVTILQLTQFSLYTIQSLNSLFYDCGYPTILKSLIFLYSMIFLYMFGKFYYTVYIVNNSETEITNHIIDGKKPVNKKN